MTRTKQQALVAALLALLLVPVAALAQSEEISRIAVSELQQKLDSGQKLLLIDVRRDDELEEHGAIPGAIHIPMAELDARMADIPKDVEVAFY